MRHEQPEEVNEATGELYPAYNKNFIQIYIDSMGFIEDIIDANPMAARVLLVLIRAMKKGSNIADFTQKDLAQYFGCSERHIQNAIKLLVERKAVRIEKSGTTNHYHINVNVAWTTSAVYKNNTKLFRDEIEFSDKYKSRPKLTTHTIKQTRLR